MNKVIINNICKLCKWRKVHNFQQIVLTDFISLGVVHRIYKHTLWWWCTDYFGDEEERYDIFGETYNYTYRFNIKRKYHTAINLIYHGNDDKQTGNISWQHKNQFAVQIERRDRCFPSQRIGKALWPGKIHNFF